MKAGEVGLSHAPFDLGIAPQRSSAGAGSVDKNALELDPERQGLSGIQNNGQTNGRDLADAPQADVTGDRERQRRFQRLQSLASRRRAKVEISVARPEIEQRNNRLGADIVQSLSWQRFREQAVCSRYSARLTFDPFGNGRPGWDSDVRNRFLQS